MTDSASRPGHLGDVKVSASHANRRAAGLLRHIYAAGERLEAAARGAAVQA